MNNPTPSTPSPIAVANPSATVSDRWRPDFEAWAKEEGGYRHASFQRFSNGIYRHPGLESDWAVWQGCAAITGLVMAARINRASHSPDNCPACLEGKLVPFRASYCTSCGTDMASPADIRANAIARRAVQAAPAGAPATVLQADWVSLALETPTVDEPVWLFEPGRGSWVGGIGLVGDGWLFCHCHDTQYQRPDGTWTSTSMEADDDYQPTHFMRLPGLPPQAETMSVTASDVSTSTESTETLGTAGRLRDLAAGRLTSEHPALEYSLAADRIEDLEGLVENLSASMITRDSLVPAAFVLRHSDIDSAAFRDALGVYALNHGLTGESAARFEIFEEIFACLGRFVTSNIAPTGALSADDQAQIDERACINWVQRQYRNAEGFDERELAVAAAAWTQACMYARAVARVNMEGPHALVEIARQDDWGVYHDDGVDRGWIKDEYGFPAFFSLERAQALCRSSHYQPHRVRQIAYDLGPRSAEHAATDPAKTTCTTCGVDRLVKPCGRPSDCSYAGIAQSETGSDPANGGGK